MRFGSILQRRLLKLESVIKLPDQRQIRDQIAAQALSNLSPEELHLLRDGMEQGRGVAAPPDPDYNEILQRANAICAQALAEHSGSVSR